MKMQPQPFDRGDVLSVPTGTPFRYRGERGSTKRRMTITVHHILNGYTWDGTNYPAYVTYPGSGGYWKDLEVTPELIAANTRESA